MPTIVCISSGPVRFVVLCGASVRRTFFPFRERLIGSATCMSVCSPSLVAAVNRLNTVMALRSLQRSLCCSPLREQRRREKRRYPNRAVVVCFVPSNAPTTCPTTTCCPERPPNRYSPRAAGLGEIGSQKTNQNVRDVGAERGRVLGRVPMAGNALVN